MTAVLSRRGLIALGGAGLTVGLARAADMPPATEPFLGPHQGGITTPQQRHVCFAAFDITTRQRDDIAALLRGWTAIAQRLTQGSALPLATANPASIPADGGSALGLSPARLTVTFGFGPGLFTKDGADRFGLAARRPEALVDLPRFNGDQLEPERTGGDLGIQACSDDPQVAFHAIRELERAGYGSIRPRWLQTGFIPDTAAGETPRNLMGFKDGTNNPALKGTRPDVPRTLDDVVWVGDEGPGWMRGGSYLVARRIRISLEHWDRTDLDFQEEVIGRRKYSGAPIGKETEFEPLDLDRVDNEGNPVIADTAHVRLGAAAMNDGALIHRRAYSYNDGARFLAERWPPWRLGVMYDAGLFFLAYQKDPRTGFIKVFEPMSKLDMLNQYTTHTGSGVFACPGGVSDGGFIGEALFRA